MKIEEEYLRSFEDFDSDKKFETFYHLKNIKYSDNIRKFIKQIENDENINTLKEYKINIENEYDDREQQLKVIFF